MTIEQLRQQAATIQNEIQEGANTAERVGILFQNMITHFSAEITALKTELKNHKDYAKMKYDDVIDFCDFFDTVEEIETTFVNYGAGTKCIAKSTAGKYANKILINNTPGDVAGITMEDLHHDALYINFFHKEQYWYSGSTVEEMYLLNPKN